MQAAQTLERRLSMRRILFIAMVVGVLVPHIMWADEGRIPVSRPTTIAASGHYILTRNITIPSGMATGILIQASNVSLDLNGFTIFGTPCCGGVETLIQIAPGVSNVVIRNGRLSGGAKGITDTGPPAGEKLRIEQVEIVQGISGIQLHYSGQVEILSCHVNADSAGIDVSSDGGRFEDSEIICSSGNWLTLSGRRAQVRENRIFAGGRGILVSGGGGNTVQDNTIQDGDPGIQINADSPRNLVTGNVITAGLNMGLSILSDGNRIAENVIGGNPGDGISISGSFNLVEGNQVEANACGINFLTAGSHLYRNNMLRGNSVLPVCGMANTNGGGNF